MKPITKDDFVVTEPDDAASIFAAYDHANRTGGDTDDLVEPYTSELVRMLVEHPSPVAVADALARRLEGPGGVEHAAAQWLADQLRQ